jgi:hypothetical protein
MTTKHSPLWQLKAQADLMAAKLKAFERGELPTNDPGGKVAGAREKEAIKFMIAMDDKFISIEMGWALIRTTSEAGISEYIVKQMREAREAVN